MSGLELAERVERLSGADRDVDAAIHSYLAREADWGGFPDWITPDNSPAYTASLDAAMTLVPEGWHWTVGTGPEDGYEAYPDHVIAWASLDRGDGATDLPYADARSPALALTAAALRARASLALDSATLGDGE